MKTKSTNFFPLFLIYIACMHVCMYVLYVCVKVRKQLLSFHHVDRGGTELRWSGLVVVPLLAETTC